MTACGRGQSQPAGPEHSQYVAVREQGHIPGPRAYLADDPIDPCADLLRTLAARTAVAKDHPRGLPGMDLLRGKPLVVTVVPFRQVRIGLGALSQARELAGLARPLQRARQHEFKR